MGVSVIKKFVAVAFIAAVVAGCSDGKAGKTQREAGAAATEAAAIQNSETAVAGSDAVADTPTEPAEEVTPVASAGFESADIHSLPLIATLQKKGDIYYDPATNQPFTGIVNPSNCSECGWQGKADMKDGKLHGKYLDMHEEGGSEGYYKNGKRDGKWVFTDEEGATSEVIYKDGEEQKK